MSENGNQNHIRSLASRVAHLTERVRSFGSHSERLDEIAEWRREGSESGQSESLVTAEPTAVGKLHYLWIEMTEKCPFRCKMCYNWKNDLSVVKPDYLTVDETNRFLRSLPEVANEGFECSFTGGEPTYNPDLLKYVATASALGFRTTFPTNGFTVDEAFARQCGEAGLTTIMLSLDALTPDQHDYMRGVKGAHEGVMRTIDLMAKFAPDVKIGILTTVMKQTLDEAVPIAKWGTEDDRIEFVNFQAITRPFGVSKEKGSMRDIDPDKDWFEDKRYRYLWPEDSSRTDRLFDELNVVRENGGKVGNTELGLNRYALYFRDPVGFTQQQDCTIGSFGIHVTATGDMFFCYYMDKLGNVRTHNMKDVWYGDLAGNVRGKIAQCKVKCDMVLNCFMER